MNFIKNYSPWILALLWLGIRWACHTSLLPNDPDTARSIGVMANLFFIIVLMFQALYIIYKERRNGLTGTFMADIKRVAFPAMKYVLGAGIAITIYYTTLSDELIVKRNQDYIALEATLDTPEKVQKVIAENSQLKGYTKDQIMTAAKERTDLFTNAKVVSSASFLVLIFVTLFYALFAVFLFRNFLKLK
jgi:hypothetical protein